MYHAILLCEFYKAPFIMYNCVISQYTVFLLYATIIYFFIF